MTIKSVSRRAIDSRLFAILVWFSLLTSATLVTALKLTGFLDTPTLVVQSVRHREHGTEWLACRVRRLEGAGSTRVSAVLLAIAREDLILAPIGPVAEGQPPQFIVPEGGTTKRVAALRLVSVPVGSSLIWPVGSADRHGLGSLDCRLNPDQPVGCQPVAFISSRSALAAPINWLASYQWLVIAALALSIIGGGARMARKWFLKPL